MYLNEYIIIKKRDVYGALFENMIIVDLIKNYNAANTHPVLSYFRDSNKKEIDLIIEYAGKVIPVEIKASQTMDNRFFDAAIWFNDKITSHQKPIVIYGGDQLQKRSKGLVVPWNNVNYIID